jgi:hypothetical protein
MSASDPKRTSLRLKASNDTLAMSADELTQSGHSQPAFAGVLPQQTERLLAWIFTYLIVLRFKVL